MSDTKKIKKDSVLEETQVFSSSDDNPKEHICNSKKKNDKMSVSDDDSNQKEVLDKIKILSENEENDVTKGKLLEAEDKAKKNFELMLRSKAELENYKKRVTREMNDLRKYATESLMKELLSVVDNLERALKSSKNCDNNLKGILEGVDLTLNEILKVLSKYSVTPIKSVGEKFDPKIHQAMSQEETSIYPKNTVIKEFLKGYLLHERLLRPAMVVVSKEPKKGNNT